MSKRLCKICKIKPPYLNFQWLIGPSSIYVAKQQRTKWNHQKKYFSYLSMIVFNIISISTVSEIGPKSTLIIPTPLISLLIFEMSRGPLYICSHYWYIDLFIVYSRENLIWGLKTIICLTKYDIILTANIFVWIKWDSND